MIYTVTSSFYIPIVHIPSEYKLARYTVPGALSVFNVARRKKARAEYRVRTMSATCNAERA